MRMSLLVLTLLLVPVAQGCGSAPEVREPSASSATLSATGMFAAGWYKVIRRGDLVGVVLMDEWVTDTDIQQQHWTLVEDFDGHRDELQIEPVSAPPSLDGSTVTFTACTERGVEDPSGAINTLLKCLPSPAAKQILEFDPGGRSLQDGGYVYSGNFELGGIWYGCEHWYPMTDYAAGGAVSVSQYDAARALICAVNEKAEVVTCAPRESPPKRDLEVTVWPIAPPRIQDSVPTPVTGHVDQ